MNEWKKFFIANNFAKMCGKYFCIFHWTFSCEQKNSDYEHSFAQKKENVYIIYWVTRWYLSSFSFSLKWSEYFASINIFMYVRKKIPSYMRKKEKNQVICFVNGVNIQSKEVKKMRQDILIYF